MHYSQPRRAHVSGRSGVSQRTDTGLCSKSSWGSMEPQLAGKLPLTPITWAVWFFLARAWRYPCVLDRSRRHQPMSSGTFWHAAYVNSPLSLICLNRIFDGPLTGFLLARRGWYHCPYMLASRQMNSWMFSSLVFPEREKLLFQLTLQRYVKIFTWHTISWYLSVRRQVSPLMESNLLSMEGLLK